MAVELTPARRKQLGAYYTSENVARFLLEASIKNANNRVLEPSFGDGVFVDVWHRMLGQQGNGTIVGCDIADDVVADARRQFPELSLHHTDFFEVLPGELGKFDLVVGNPPFVRHHRLNKTSQTLAMRRAEQAGITLYPLTSIWVPFLIHATQHLESGGGLAVVTPLELTYARYAAPLREYLCKNFGGVRIVVLDRPLFPQLSQSALLLLARDWGSSCNGVDVVHADSIEQLSATTIWSQASQHIPYAEWRDSERHSHHLRLPADTQELFNEVTKLATPLENLARITIGYVTGNNSWFHLTHHEVSQLSLSHDVRLVLRRGADLSKRGLSLSAEDYSSLATTGAHWLFSPEQPLSSAAQERIDQGEDLGVHQAYKCKVRAPWWKVPGVHSHQFTIGVLSTNGPRLIATDIPATNSLLVGDLISDVKARTLAAAALTSLASLSAEVVGHPLGGGALKMEPAEARRWTLPVIDGVDDSLDQIDDAMRNGDVVLATALADDLFLRKGLGLSPSEIRLLQNGVLELRRWRMRYE